MMWPLDNFRSFVDFFLCYLYFLVYFVLAAFGRRIEKVCCNSSVFELQVGSSYVRCLITLADSYVKLSLVPEMKIAEFAKSVDLDEVAHNEPPHLDPHCLPSSL